ncbi:hypothetical protein BGZ59_002177 [Podila verticillata]|nr:hypothetical protein BGZ59_002177 [Podila verticillata]
MSTDITSQKEEHLPEKHPGVELTEKPFDIDEEDENSPSVWVLGFFFTAIGAVITQYNFFRTTYSSYSIFFLSLNPGPFNIKEHAAIGIAVNSGASAAYAVDILAATDLFLEYRIDAIGGIL